MRANRTAATATNMGRTSNNVVHSALRFSLADAASQDVRCANGAKPNSVILSASHIPFLSIGAMTLA